MKYAALVSVALQSQPVLAEEPVTFDDKEVARHLLIPPNFHLALTATQHPVEFELIVGKDGRIESLTPVRGDTAYSAEAGRIFSKILFKPFLQDGRPVRVKLRETGFSDDPIETAPPPTPFPETTDPATLFIALHRSSCYGPCPDYTVRIAGDGTVSYNGAAQPAEKATRRHVEALLRMLRRMDFYTLKDRYVAQVTDNPTYSVTVSIGGRSKRIVDYVGRHIGMPDSITNLENMIDFAADTSRWQNGTSHDVETLKAQYFDFASPQGSAVLIEVANMADLDAILEFEDAGAKFQDNERSRQVLAWVAERGETEIVAHMLKQGVAGGDPAAKIQALCRAAERGRMATVKALIAGGADPAVAEHFSTMSPLFAAARPGDAELVELILSYHPDMSKRVSGTTSAGEVYETAVGEAVNGTSWRKKSGAEVSRVIRDLATAGAEIDADTFHGSALTHAREPEVIKTLLELGADPNIGGRGELRPLDVVPTEDLAVLMIQHGADFTKPSPYGITLAERARAYHWQKVLDLIAGKSP